MYIFSLINFSLVVSLLFSHLIGLYGLIQPVDGQNQPNENNAQSRQSSRTEYLDKNEALQTRGLFPRGLNYIESSLSLQEWKALAMQNNQPLETFVMHAFAISEEDRDLLAGVGFVETRSMGIEAIGLVEQVTLNRIYHPEFLEISPELANASTQFAYIDSTYRWDYRRYVKATLAGFTKQSSQAQLLKGAQDFAWRLLAGYQIDQPTFFLEDKGALWVSMLPPERDLDSVLANIQKSHDYLNVYEFNVHASRLDEAITDLDRRKLPSRMFASIVTVANGEYALITLTTIGEAYVPNVALDFQCPAGTHAVPDRFNLADGTYVGYACEKGESGWLRYARVADEGGWIIVRQKDAAWENNLGWFWAR